MRKAASNRKKGPGRKEAGRKSRGRANDVRDPAATEAALLDAAEAAFNAYGFEGTDTNRIAKAAGFAPQTFYRHFEDKRAVFLAVYERWWKDELAALEKSAQERPEKAEAAARIALAFHTKWRGFRRALRHLAIVDPKVRAARVAARRAQIAHIARIRTSANQEERDEAALTAALLKAERICDAAADGEFADLDLSPAAAKSLVIAAMQELLGPAG